MATLEELGLDERATEMLTKLPVEKQQIAIEKLQAGIAAGKVRNASGYIVGVLNGPDLLDIDENAMKMLNELPLDAKKSVIEKLRKTTDVRNPSAWVARAVISAKREAQQQQQQQPQHQHPSMAIGMAPVVGGGALTDVHRGGGLADQIGGRIAALDQSSKSLLQSLPITSQQEILGRLMIQGEVRNPSAWLVKACMQAGAVATLQVGAIGAVVGGGRSASVAQPVASTSYAGFDPMVAEMLRLGRGGQPIVLDTGACNLLQSLPVDTQQDLVGKLCMQDGVKNPSGWMVKACLQEGATSNPNVASPRVPQQRTFVQQQQQPTVHQGHVELDDGARTMLAKLPAPTQQDILSRLAQTPDVKNPSAWVVKSALQAGASGGGGAVGGTITPSLGGGPVIGASLPARAPVAIGQPPRGNYELDQQSLALLQSLPEHVQQDIVQKLNNSWAEGKIQNPSAWVAKACLKAGATSSPGAGQGSMRASPY